MVLSLDREDEMFFWLSSFLYRLIRPQKDQGVMCYQGQQTNEGQMECIVYKQRKYVLLI